MIVSAFASFLSYGLFRAIRSVLFIAINSILTKSIFCGVSNFQEKKKIVGELFFLAIYRLDAQTKSMKKNSSQWLYKSNSRYDDRILCILSFEFNNTNVNFVSIWIICAKCRNIWKWIQLAHIRSGKIIIRMWYQSNVQVMKNEQKFFWFLVIFYSFSERTHFIYVFEIILFLILVCWWCVCVCSFFVDFFFVRDLFLNKFSALSDWIWYICIKANDFSKRGEKIHRKKLVRETKNVNCTNV